MTLWSRLRTWWIAKQQAKTWDGTGGWPPIPRPIPPPPAAPPPPPSRRSTAERQSRPECVECGVELAYLAGMVTEPRCSEHSIHPIRLRRVSEHLTVFDVSSQQAQPFRPSEFDAGCARLVGNLGVVLIKASETRVCLIQGGQGGSC